MIGDRYGASYLPPRINQAEFELLRKEMIPNELKFAFDKLNFNVDDIVEFCYKLDSNRKIKDFYEYRLLDVDTILVNSKIEVIAFLPLLELNKRIKLYFIIKA